MTQWHVVYDADVYHIVGSGAAFFSLRGKQKILNAVAKLIIQIEVKIIAEVF